jgi:hypothetical protein
LKSKGFSLIETVVFIVLAAVVIPIFYLTTQPVIKDMMTPTTYIKARFVAEKKMEELMAYRFTDPTLNVGPPVGPSAVSTDTAFPAAGYAGYQWQWAITYLGCGGTGGSCVDYTDNSAVLSPTSNITSYKQIDVTVTAPGGVNYRASSMVTARY